MYNEKIATLFNSEIINKVCTDIDNNHPKINDLKLWLLQLINSSVDLSVKCLSIKPYQDAYKFVEQDIK